MDNLLTSQQVQDLLKVERITVYRMLQDGRLKGVKIGQQWRFKHGEVERLLSASSLPPTETDPYSRGFPTHCVQTIQELLAEVGQISARMVDMDGQPLTAVSRPCEFCTLVEQSPSGAEACRASWHDFARQSQSGSKYFTCHAGYQYVGAPVEVLGQFVGLFLVGQFSWNTADPRDLSGRMQSISSTHRLPLEMLQQAAAEVQVIAPDQQSRVETWPSIAGRAVHSIMTERSCFLDKLQQIAALTQIT